MLLRSAFIIVCFNLVAFNVMVSQGTGEVMFT